MATARPKPKPKAKPKRNHCELALIALWTIGVLILGSVVAGQSIEANRAGTNSDYIAGRISVVSLLTLPMFGIVVGVLPIKKRHQELLSSGCLNALISSVVYIIGVFAIVWFENDYYPGQLMNMCGYWGILIVLCQSYTAWAITRLASR